MSALAYLFYHPDAFALAGDQVGGLFKKAEGLGPLLLWKTNSMTRFMTDVFPGTEVPVRTVRVGYYYQSRLWDEAELEESGETAEVRRLYSLRTRGTEPKASYMSSGRGSFEVYDVKVQDLVDVLLERVSMRLISKKAQSVDLYDRTAWTVERSFEYDTLISTIPAPMLLSLTGNDDLERKLVAYDKVYHRVGHEDMLPMEVEAAKQGLDYVYVVDGHDFHRTRIVRGESGVFVAAVREYTLLPGVTYPVDGTRQRGGQIVGGREVLKQLPSSVELYGRYAEWDHSVRLEHVLDAVQP